MPAQTDKHRIAFQFLPGETPRPAASCHQRSETRSLQWGQEQSLVSPGHPSAQHSSDRPPAGCHRRSQRFRTERSRKAATDTEFCLCYLDSEQVQLIKTKKERTRVFKGEMHRLEKECNSKSQPPLACWTAKGWMSLGGSDTRA